MEIEGVRLEASISKVIEENESVRKMALRVFRMGGSSNTLRNYVVGVRGFCKWLKKSPDEVIKLKKTGLL